MNDQNQININNDELRIAFEGEQMSKKSKRSKKNLTLSLIGVAGLIGGVAMLLVNFLVLNKPQGEINFGNKETSDSSSDVYSDLTGEKLADASLKTAPTYCIQTPNGTDGARPQSGIKEAGVVFEAIAEAGITRFAAIYQNPTSAVIGPIRSLRIYYLQWDTPFDCTIVHAGGADDALAAVASGGYKDLSENYQYMYRGTYSNRLWNNLFTTASYLKQFSSDKGYTTSNVKGFTRMTPVESNKSRADNLAVNKLEITKPAGGNTSELAAKVTSANLRLGGWSSFNVRYDYDAESNTYLRSYENGNAHEVYQCSGEDLGEKNPEDICSLSQVSPSVVVAMIVKETKASDNYHEDITAIGSGKAYILQNGIAIEGTWNKASTGEQIKFLDTDGNEIKLAPGQTFVTAVPDYGSVEF
jgi:hypothetical protein